MNTDELKKFLTQSLDDKRLSRGEKSVFKSLLDDVRPSLHDQEALLHHAFGLVREKLADFRDREILEWLEAVVKILRPTEGVTLSGSRLAQAFFFPGGKDLDKVLALLSACRRSLDICVFTITHDQIAYAVLTAHRKGAKVRILTDDDKVRDLGSDIERLARAGIAVRTDHSPTLMHHNFAILDGKALLTGSFNWTRSAAEENQENILLTDDPLLLASYKEEFERLWVMFKKRQLD